MKRLFGSLVTASYNGTQEHRGFVLKNVLIADDLELNDKEMKRLAENMSSETNEQTLWTPQTKTEAGQWRSQVRLSNNFFQECITNPVPIDLRAYKVLRASPLAMDVYTWLTYRMSYTQRRSRPIRWEPLMMQFGSGFNTNDMEQAVRDFKKGFLRALKMVLLVYPQAAVEINPNGLVLLPSRPHVLPLKEQQALF